ncbi:OmpA family protein [Komagataeibacter sp. FNDCF1]|uniref:OmpA family protein n=1 Tax=Komagataeibacter sp. FNDCF1 TaxID=2878681 RepID=UPI001E479EDC|nr:OmpA family protein [Komagataeibacter sp. FNDCF1]MCE2564900.1 OmpA family protein [Komagataeibacter sp. FNDCF1]
MGKRAPSPSPGRFFFPPTGCVAPLRAVFLALLATGTAGCAHHQDTVDALSDWYHRYQGGVIGQQRPPPPGTHQPYPKIGLGPNRLPSLPSPDLREDITTDLEAQREFNQRQDAIMGTMPTIADIPPVPTHPLANSQSASLQAADGTDAGTSSGAPTHGGNATPRGERGMSTQPEPARDSSGKLLMPEITTTLPDHPEAVPANLPPIAAAPPELPSVGGISLPDNAARDGMDLPAYHLASPDDGEPVRFLSGSDQIEPGEEDVVGSIVQQRGNRFVIVNGYGNAATATAEGQTAALNLAILRARTLTRLLLARGVPASRITVRAHAFGNGARLAIVR